MDAKPQMPKSDSNRCNSLSVSIVSNAAEMSSRKENALGTRLHARIQIIDDSEQSSLMVHVYLRVRLSIRVIVKGRELFVGNVGNHNLSLKVWLGTFRQMKYGIFKIEAALGEVRTHNLCMSLMPASLYTVHKYGALTDCATGADVIPCHKSKCCN